MIVEQPTATPSTSTVGDDGHSGSHEPGGEESAGRQDRIARLRHDLRNPVSQILGYGELLIEEVEEGGWPGSLDGLRSILARGREVLSLINNGLASDEARTAIDLPALSLRLHESLNGIIADCDTLRREADRSWPGEIHADLEKIRAAATQLIEMADQMLAVP